ncbi:MAG: DUF559 domain-containing protein [Peptococcaceae bacterium]|nr:DUF559 domain-containing protein [Peptococcaceae bacterium]
MSSIIIQYHIVQQWVVGNYRIDMVVLYKGNSVAIECDGELYHSGDEKVREDMERQAILERIGWRFIRIRGSEYFRDPEKTMERVKRELNEYGIYPESVLNEPSEQPSSLLLDRVKIRAAQILDEWYSQSDDIDISNEPVISTASERVTTLPLKKVNNEFKQMMIEQYLLPKKIQVKEQETKDLVIRNKKASVESSRPPVSTIKENLQKRTVNKRMKSPSKEELFINLLKTAGIRYIDNRAQSGIIWVPLSDIDNKKIKKIIDKCRLRCSFENRGSKATNNQPAWRIMVD